MWTAHAFAGPDVKNKIAGLLWSSYEKENANSWGRFTFTTITSTWSQGSARLDGIYSSHSGCCSISSTTLFWYGMSITMESLVGSVLRNSVCGRERRAGKL